MIFRRPKPDTPPDPPPTDGPRDAFEAAWPFNADSPLVAGIARPDRFLSILLVDLTGLDWAAIDSHLPTVRETAAEKQMVPVLAVDLLNFGDLSKAGVAYDTLPNAAANAALDPTLDWHAYIARRRQLLREKWRPAAIITLGTGPDWDTP